MSCGKVSVSISLLSEALRNILIASYGHTEQFLIHVNWNSDVAVHSVYLDFGRCDTLNFRFVSYSVSLGRYTFLYPINIYVYANVIPHS